MGSAIILALAATAAMMAGGPDTSSAPRTGPVATDQVSGRATVEIIEAATVRIGATRIDVRAAVNHQRDPEGRLIQFE
ncbi:MAG: hypothetical protein AAF205_07305 [Pseudomonadota bacterium]